MKTKLFLVILIFITSCNAHPSALQKSTDSSSFIASSDYDSNTTNFRRFLAKFKPAKLPLIIRPFDDDPYSRLPLIYGRDSIFIQTEYKDSSLDKVYAYRILPDTINSFKVIWMEPAEMSIPVLTTFSKSGNKISEESLTLGQCGSDCCFTCNETIIINQDLSIYSADSIKSCTCDSTGPKENTMKKYVMMKTGRISGDGKIQLSKMTRKEQ